ncbi:hypothetical protein C2845_PM04G15890 [Panicum miliaceum]|uniref:Uncharacterized protein n=1 Tax=Panicum miliaceum TaxID=4540 RepID=A0A3L6QVZ9_PANMI|nr:hypothetical protein C2845_PM04G15890 [Panicum miliaceum]
MTNGSEASPAAPKTTKDTLGTPIDPKTPAQLNPNNFDQTGARSESPRVNPNVEVLYDGPTEFDPDDDEDPTVAYAKKPYIYPPTMRTLLLKELEIRRDLCKDIAGCFDLDTEEFIINGKRLKLSMKDVQHILGLPSQGDEIKEPPQKHVLGLFQIHMER